VPSAASDHWGYIAFLLKAPADDAESVSRSLSRIIVHTAPYSQVLEGCSHPFGRYMPLH